MDRFLKISQTVNIVSLFPLTKLSILQSERKIAFFLLLFKYQVPVVIKPNENDAAQ
jgi:hypothetical protein